MTERDASVSGPREGGLRVDIDQRRPSALQIRLECPPGQTLALFGPSGSGKTSALRAVAGLNTPHAGHIEVDGVPWFDSARGISLPPQARSVGYVFQEYALFPHLSVLENISSAMGHVAARQRSLRARALLGKVHLDGLEQRRPAQLSGGQRQRVALARALAREPRVLLLDEPFSAVDAPVRKALYQELVEVRRSLDVPMLLVTHDYQEVLRFADSVAILDSGRLVAQGTIGEISRRTDLPLLEALGEPASAFDARVSAIHAERGLIEIALGAQRLLAPFLDLPVGTRVRVRVAARDVVLALRPVAELSIHNQLRGTVLDTGTAVAGATATVVIRVEGVTLLAHVTRDAVRQLSLQEGGPVCVLIKSVAIDAIERPVVAAAARDQRPA
jgi:molybdate transport system ATP-binding protein